MASPFAVLQSKVERTSTMESGFHNLHLYQQCDTILLLGGMGVQQCGRPKYRGSARSSLSRKVAGPPHTDAEASRVCNFVQSLTLFCHLNVKCVEIMLKTHLLGLAHVIPPPGFTGSAQEAWTPMRGSTRSPCPTASSMGACCCCGEMICVTLRERDRWP